MIIEDRGTADRISCARCGSGIAASMLSCPACGTLIHADRLRALAADAEAASAREDWSAALGAWRDALALLPAQSSQHAAISARITELSGRVGAGPARPAAESKSMLGRMAGLGALALLVWKFKWIAAFLLTKGKLLLLGLTKGSTFFSMVLSLGVYWTAFGWKFALGLVLSIYVHEMGHVAMLRRYGIKASAPMFIPGLGAMVRMKQYPHDAREEARVGLAGPVWGLGAALFAWAVWQYTGWQSWGAIARVGAWINLFNLIPVWQLDGSRAFVSLTRTHRWIAVGAIALAWIISHEGMLVLLLAAALFRAFGKEFPDRTDTPILLQYCGLVLVLAWMCTLAVNPAL